MLELRNIGLTVNGESWLTDINLTLPAGRFNVLLGATLAGKTSLMRIIAGLEKPSAGGVYFGGEDITGMAVQARRTAMVYQQFVNYPMMSVFDNIASPLRAEKMATADIKRRVHDTAALLKLTPFLARRPAELSGGQQQRVALARALVKEARTILLDDPLVNLDYKLREELCEELPRLLAGRNTVVVYATSDPAEALQLGGATVALHEGRVMQVGDTGEVYRYPDNFAAASIFSDPPLNVARVIKKDRRLRAPAGDDNALDFPALGYLADIPDGDYSLAFRAHHLSDEKPDDTAITVTGRIQVAEITGSECFVHLRVGDHDWVMQTTTIKESNIGSELNCYLQPRHIMVFDRDKNLVRAGRAESGHGKN